MRTQPAGRAAAASHLPVRVVGLFGLRHRGATDALTPLRAGAQGVGGDSWKLAASDEDQLAAMRIIEDEDQLRAMRMLAASDEGSHVFRPLC